MHLEIRIFDPDGLQFTDRHMPVYEVVPSLHDIRELSWHDVLHAMSCGAVNVSHDTVISYVSVTFVEVFSAHLTEMMLIVAFVPHDTPISVIVIYAPVTSTSLTRAYPVLTFISFTIPVKIMSKVPATSLMVVTELSVHAAI